MQQSSKIFLQMENCFSDGEEQDRAEMAWMNVKLQSIFVDVMDGASSSSCIIVHWEWESGTKYMLWGYFHESGNNFQAEEYTCPNYVQLQLSWVQIQTGWFEPATIKLKAFLTPVGLWQAADRTCCDNHSTLHRVPTSPCYLEQIPQLCEKWGISRLKVSMSFSIEGCLLCTIWRRQAWELSSRMFEDIFNNTYTKGNMRVNQFSCHRQ